MTYDRAIAWGATFNVQHAVVSHGLIILSPEGERKVSGSLNQEGI
jgi:hypothetical protein